MARFSYSSTFYGTITIYSDKKMRITKRQLKRIIREEYSRLKRRGLLREMQHNVISDKLQTALDKGYGEGPVSDSVARLIYQCVVKGSAKGDDTAIGYASAALENAGYSVGMAGEVAESDVDIIVSYDEMAGTGMLYFTMHPKFQYSM